MGSKGSNNDNGSDNVGGGSTNNSPFKVIIVGAGLAGSLLANGLLRHGVAVAIYERLPAASERHGYQITLGAPALEGMRACLDAAHIRALVARFGRSGGGSSSGTRKTRAPVIYDMHFNPLVDLTRLPNYSKSAPINRNVLRDSLAKPVYDAGKLSYGCAFTHYEVFTRSGSSKRDSRNNEEEAIRVHFDDGSYDDCDALIGAEGSHSRVNIQVGLNNIKSITSHWSFIAKADLSAESVKRLPSVVLEKQVLVFSQNMTMYFSVYLPDESGDQTSRTVSNEKLSSCMMAISLPVEICPEDIASRSSSEQFDLIKKSIRDWAKEYHDMLEAVRGSPFYAYRMRTSSKPAEKWRQKARDKGAPEAGHPRVWLLGDACHAMFPNRGMGGNQAMKDTATALPLLVNLAQSKGEQGSQAASIADACTKYEAEMIPRAFQWVRKSGGDSLVPFDTSKLSSKVAFAILAQLVKISVVWGWITSFIWKPSTLDDAPEFRD